MCGVLLNSICFYWIFFKALPNFNLIRSMQEYVGLTHTCNKFIFKKFKQQREGILL